MSEEKRIELSKEDGKTESQEEVNEESKIVNRETLNVNEEVNQLKTENSKLETANMEVHHHPHIDSHLHRKKISKNIFLLHNASLQSN